MKLKTAMTVLSTVFLLLSPFVLYVTLSQDRVDLAALALAGWVILRALPTLVVAEPAQRATALRLPAIALGFALLGGIFHRGWVFLLMPSAIQATFGVTFLRSLSGTPLVEHFARMVKPTLSPAERAHCRAFTKVWGLYLVALAAVGLAFTGLASLAAWTVYTGVVSYALIGLLYAIEFLSRPRQPA